MESDIFCTGVTIGLQAASEYFLADRHSLNGSSSPVLTATFLFYGKPKIRPPTESKPLNRLR